MTAIDAPWRAWGRWVALVGWGLLWGGSGWCPAGDSMRKGEREQGTIGVMCLGLATPWGNPCPNTHPALGTYRRCFPSSSGHCKDTVFAKRWEEARREENLDSPPPSHLPLSLLLNLFHASFEQWDGSPEERNPVSGPRPRPGAGCGCVNAVPWALALGLIHSSQPAFKPGENQKTLMREKQLFSSFAESTP